MKSAFSIGEFYVGSSVNKRNINIFGFIKDNFYERTQYLYKMFPNSDEGTLLYYEDEHSAKINYIVEKVIVEKKGPIRHFSISLTCFNPYFSDVDESRVSLSEWIGGIEFPLEFINDEIEFEKRAEKAIVDVINPSNIDSGLRIIFIANGKVLKPSLKNIANQEIITIDLEMNTGDIIEVTTFMNDKNILLKRNGEVKNINNYLLYGTKFLQLKSGINNFKLLAEKGLENLTTEIYYSINYEAI